MDEETSGVVTYTESGSLDAINIGSFISFILVAGVSGFICGCAVGPFGFIIGAAMDVGVSLVGSQIAARNLIYDMNFNLGEYPVELAIQCAVLGMTAFGLGQMIKYSIENPLVKEDKNPLEQLKEAKTNDDLLIENQQRMDLEPYNFPNSNAQEAKYKIELILKDYGRTYPNAYITCDCKYGKNVVVPGSFTGYYDNGEISFHFDLS